MKPTLLRKVGGARAEREKSVNSILIKLSFEHILKIKMRKCGQARTQEYAQVRS